MLNEPFPDIVNLGRTEFKISEQDDKQIIFSQLHYLRGCQALMKFTKTADCWFFEINSNGCPHMASHFEKAYNIVKRYHGKNYESLSKAVITNA